MNIIILFVIHTLFALKLDPINYTCIDTSYLSTHDTSDP